MGRYQRSHASRRKVASSLPMRVTRIFLSPEARRRGKTGTSGSRDEDPVNLFPGLFRSTAGRHAESEYSRDCEDCQQRGAPDVNRDEQPQCDGQTKDPAARRKERRVHVVEHKDLIAQHCQTVEKFRAFVVFDAYDRCLEMRHLSFERDRDAVTETPGRAVADHAKKPGGCDCDT